MRAHLVPEPAEVLLVGLVVPLYVDRRGEGRRQLCVCVRCVCVCRPSVLVLTVQLSGPRQKVYRRLLGHDDLFPGVAAGDARQAHQEGKCELPLHRRVCWWWWVFLRGLVCC